MTIFFTSDSHWRHKKIVDFEQRPFESVEEMNEGLIKAWNNVVKPKDTVYHMGDFCFGSYSKWIEIIEQLNGEIVLIKGNHDSSETIRKLHKNGYLKEIHMVGYYMKAGGYILNLTHYPMEIGNRPRNFSIHGHIHSQSSRMLNQINVGIDSPLNCIDGFNITKFGQPISLVDDLIPYLNYINPKVEELFQQERGV